MLIIWYILIVTPSNNADFKLQNNSIKMNYFKENFTILCFTHYLV